MAIIDDRTSNQDYPKPYVGNDLIDDVARLRAALDAIDGDVATLFATFVAKASLNSPAFIGTPTAPTPAPGDNSGKLATTAFVRLAVAALVDSAPGALDTLNELAAALGDDPNFAATVSAQIGLKLATADLATAFVAALNAATIDSLIDDSDKVGFRDSATGAFHAIVFSTLVSSIFKTTRKIDNAVFDAPTFRLKNAANFSVVFGNSGLTADRTLTLPDLDQTLYPGWEVVENVTLSAVASYVRTGLDAFRELRILGELYTSSDAQLLMSLSTNNGSSWINSSDHYNGVSGLANGAGVTGGTNSDTSIFLSWNTLLAASDFNFESLLYNFNKPRRFRVQSDTSGYIAGSGAPFSYQATSYGSAANVTARNALRILPTAGALSGTLTLLGKKG